MRASVAALALAAAGPLLGASLRLDLAQNVGYADGPKLAAQVKPGGTMGTIPWFVARPYTGTHLVLERMDRNRWADQDYVARTLEQCDFLLFPEYWLAEDAYVRRLVDEGFRRLESYPNGVVLYQKRGDEPTRRRPRS